MLSREALLEQLAVLRERGANAAALAKAELGERTSYWQREVTAAVQISLDRVAAEVSELSAHDDFCASVLRRTTGYADWLQWTLWDLPLYAAAIEPDPVSFQRELSACCLVYFTCRILDDFLDRHYLYRGRRETLLAALRTEGARADGITVILAILLCVEGISHAGNSLRPLLASVKRVLIGLLLEYSQPGSWNEAFYERLVELKNVDYQRILYAALDPDRVSLLFPFLTGYYTVAQKLNDAQDHSRDVAQGRPNLVGMVGFAEAETRIGADLFSLGKQALEMPERERLVALTKLAETLEEARRAGLFLSESPIATQPRPDSAGFGITWQSDLQEILERIGERAIEETRCSVCGDSRRKFLFRKQGFAWHACGGCEHVFVSPRLRADVARDIRRELADIPVVPEACEKLYGAEWARMLRSEAAGVRLLDVRFQSGIFPRSVRAEGFQVYGAGDPARLRLLFGERVADSDLEAGKAPWGNFDVVTAIHSLDRFTQPGQVLRGLRAVMNDDGLLFVVVPDFQSIQFRIFGKRWNQMNPLARNQMFTYESLSRLLGDSGFEPLMRVKTPPRPQGTQTRWMRLFRELNGDETGDLVVLARAAEPVTTPGADSLD